MDATTIVEQLQSANSERDIIAGKLTALEKDHLALMEAAEALRAKIAEGDAALTSAKAEADALRTKLADAEANLAEKEKLLALEVVPQAGTKPVDETPSNGEPSASELQKQFSAIVDPAAKREFWAKHKRALSTVAR